MTFARIVGTGSYLPEKILTNDDISKFVDTSDEWIRERTGIRQRHVAAEGQTTSDLGIEAAKRALAAAGVDVSEIDLLVVAFAIERRIEVIDDQALSLVAFRAIECHDQRRQQNEVRKHGDHQRNRGQ